MDLLQKMLPYQKEIESILQEKASLIDTYKNDMDLALGQIKQLQRDKVLLGRDVDALSSMCRGCPNCSCQLDDLRSPSSIDGDVPVRSRVDVTERVLLERIRVLEAERMMLQLENENQQLQYERFLDVIANHIVEAIVSQKNLKEECVGLQKRVVYLECQNHELAQLLRNRYQFSSAPTLQSEKLFDATQSLPLTNGRSFRSLGQTKSWLLSQDFETQCQDFEDKSQDFEIQGQDFEAKSQDFEATRNLSDECDLDQGCARASHGTSARDSAVGHSLDTQIRQVLQLTRELCVLADVSAEFDGCRRKEVLDASLEDNISRGKELDGVSSSLPVRSLLSDGLSTDSEDTGSWDVNYVDCCCASLSELLDQPTEEQVDDGNGLTPRSCPDEDMISATNAIVDGKGSVELLGSKERQAQFANGKMNSTDFKCCAFKDDKQPHSRAFNTMETVILGTEASSTGAGLLNEHSSSFIDYECCAKISSSITNSSLSTIRIPLQLDNLATSASSIKVAAPVKSSTTQTSESLVENSLNRFSTSFGRLSLMSNQLDDAQNPVCARTTFLDSKTISGKLRGCFQSRISAPMDDGGSAPSSLSSYQKTSKDINNMMEQSYRIQSPYRPVDSSDNSRSLSCLFDYQREAKRVRHRESWPSENYGQNNIGCTYAMAARQFVNVVSKPEMFYCCDKKDERSTSMPLGRQTVLNEKPMRPHSDSCINCSLVSRGGSLSQLDSCNCSGSIVWITPAIHSDSFQDGWVHRTSRQNSYPVSTAIGFSVLPVENMARLICSASTVGNATTELRDSRAEHLEQQGAEDDTTCLPSDADDCCSKIISQYDTYSFTVADLKTQCTSCEKRQNHNHEKSSSNSSQELTTDVKPLLENQNGFTGNDASSLFLAKAPTQRLSLETKGLCENMAESFGLTENLHTVRGANRDLHGFSDIDAKRLSTARGVSSAQFGSVETTPLVADGANEDAKSSFDQARDFDEISAQMRSLAETVDHLERVLLPYCYNEAHKMSSVSQTSYSFLPSSLHHGHLPDTEAAVGNSDDPLQRTRRTSGDAAQGCWSDAAGTKSDPVDETRRCQVALNYTQVNEEQVIFESVDDILCNDGILPNTDPSGSALPLVPDEIDGFRDAAVTEADSHPAASPCSFMQLRSPWSEYDLSTSEDNSSEEETRSLGDGFVRHFRFRCRQHLGRTINHRRPMMGSKRLLTHARLKSHSQNTRQSDDSSAGRHLDDASPEEYDAGDSYRRQMKSSSDGRLVQKTKLYSPSDKDLFDSGQRNGPEGSFALGPLQHRSVLVLKRESQLEDAGYRGRQSGGPEGGRRESGQLGRRPKLTGSGSSYWSLSDSCFETFSGSNPRVNDTTVL